LEQIDVSINLIEKYSDDFQLCRTANDVEDAIRGGRIASLFGLEGYVLPHLMWFRD
jgi:membrane dipeptidase